ncbi:MAG: chemotaxis protein CheD [Bacteroidales bacterium]|jgi:chemotaxis protein CheD|nr:chemotaxis protein CheD [Bacteroidales bacterium]
MEDLPRYLLYPADIFVDKVPHIVSTVLGSCVSVCLYSPQMQIGAINHYILPQWNGNDLATMKYGNLAIIRILEGLLNFGCKYEDIEAKVLGGAEVLTGTPTRFHIGRRNVKIATEILNEFKIPIVFSNIGGDTGRKITFNTKTGEVDSYFIQKKINSTVDTIQKRNPEGF